MPMVVLAVRIMVFKVFKDNYPRFFSNKNHDAIATKLINDVIT